MQKKPWLINRCCLPILGDYEANARHGYLTYRHQLNAVQYAEITVMDNECLGDGFGQTGTAD